MSKIDSFQDMVSSLPPMDAAEGEHIPKDAQSEAEKEAPKEAKIVVSKLEGEILPGVSVGKRVTVRKGAVVKSGVIADHGSICEGDIVECAYSYHIEGSIFPLVITQKYVTVGCLPIPLKYLYTGNIEDAEITGGLRARQWFEKFGEQGRQIVIDHLEEFGPKEMLEKCPS